MVGKDAVLSKALLAILARGHILLEDIPGVGKTTMALAFSRALSLRYHRVQFTPDVMPSDLTGFTMFNKATGQMEYQPGRCCAISFWPTSSTGPPAAPSRPCWRPWRRGQVTVDGVTHPVPQPFLVIATPEPGGASGTSCSPTPSWTASWSSSPWAIPLRPMRPSSCGAGRAKSPLPGGAGGHSGRAGGLRHRRGPGLSGAMRCASTSSVSSARPGSTRSSFRGQPRATLAVAAMSRAAAFVRGRDYVTPNDVRLVSLPTPFPTGFSLPGASPARSAARRGHPQGVQPLPSSEAAPMLHRRIAYGAALLLALLFLLCSTGYAALFFLLFLLILPLLSPWRWSLPAALGGTLVLTCASPSAHPRQVDRMDPLLFQPSPFPLTRFRARVVLEDPFPPSASSGRWTSGRAPGNLGTGYPRRTLRCLDLHGVPAPPV